MSDTIEVLTEAVRGRVRLGVMSTLCRSQLSTARSMVSSRRACSITGKQTSPPISPTMRSARVQCYGRLLPRTARARRGGTEHPTGS